MTENVITLDQNQSGSDALIMMAKHNIRHIPVMDGENIVGVITATDLIRQQSHHSIYLVNEIARADAPASLVSLSKQIPAVLHNLVENNISAEDTAHLVSSIGEAIIRRLIKLALEQLGEAPVPFAFIIAGSMARHEQTGISDQDNALFLSDDYDEAVHGDYFLKLAQFVSDGLNACGYIYCPGDVMATNQKWRQPVKVWKRYFHRWITEPEPKALMYASIFFDLRCVHGDDSLLQSVQQEVLEKSGSNTIFLKLMADNALSFRPPIGLFRHFVMEDNGHEEKALNMKKRGVVPVVDLARVYALSAGIAAIGTSQRLQLASEAGVLSRDGMHDLVDAFEFISAVRLKHQSRQSAAGEKIDNYVKPEMLSHLERRHLKDAFDVVRDIQAALHQRY